MYVCMCICQVCCSDSLINGSADFDGCISNDSFWPAQYKRKKTLHDTTGTSGEAWTDVYKLIIDIQYTVLSTYQKLLILCCSACKLNHIVVELKCNQDSMLVIGESLRLISGLLKVKNEKLYENDPSCVENVRNVFHFEANFPYKSCGTTKLVRLNSVFTFNISMLPSILF